MLLKLILCDPRLSCSGRRTLFLVLIDTAIYIKLDNLPRMLHNHRRRRLGLLLLLYHDSDIYRLLFL
jgi:hypothetical protein